MQPMVGKRGASAAIVLSVALLLYMMPLQSAVVTYCSDCGGVGSTTASTTITSSTTALTTTSTTIQTTSSTTIPTTTAQSSANATTSTIAQTGSPASAPTSTIVPNGPGRYTTTSQTTVITTTIAPQHGNLALSETGLPGGVIFAAYLDSEQSFVYATNTSVNGTIVFANINTGEQAFTVLNITVNNTKPGGWGTMYQPIPVSGSVNISENRTSAQFIRFVSSPVAPTTVPTTTVPAPPPAGGVGGVIQNFVNTIKGFFNYMFSGA